MMPTEATTLETTIKEDSERDTEMNQDEQNVEEEKETNENFVSPKKGNVANSQNKFISKSNLSNLSNLFTKEEENENENESKDDEEEEKKNKNKKKNNNPKIKKDQKKSNGINNISESKKNTLVLGKRKVKENDNVHSQNDNENNPNEKKYKISPNVSEAPDLEAIMATGVDLSKDSFIPWEIIKPGQWHYWLQLGPVEQKKIKSYNGKTKKEEIKYSYWIPVGRNPATITNYSEEDKYVSFKYYQKDIKFAFGLAPYVAKTEENKEPNVDDGSGNYKKFQKGKKDEKEKNQKDYQDPSIQAQVTFFMNEIIYQKFKAWLSALDAYITYNLKKDKAYAELKGKDYVYKKAVKRGKNKKDKETGEQLAECFDDYWRGKIAYDRKTKGYDLTLFLNNTLIPSTIKDKKKAKLIPNKEHENFWKDLKDKDFIKTSNYEWGAEIKKLNCIDTQTNIFLTTYIVSLNLIGQLSKPVDPKTRLLPNCSLPFENENEEEGDMTEDTVKNQKKEEREEEESNN